MNRPNTAHKRIKAQLVVLSGNFLIKCSSPFTSDTFHDVLKKSPPNYIEEAVTGNLDASPPPRTLWTEDFPNRKDLTGNTDFGRRAFSLQNRLLKTIFFSGEIRSVDGMHILA